MAQPSVIESLSGQGKEFAEQASERIKTLVAGGNARRVVILHDGQSFAEFPLTVGLVAGTAGVLLAPLLAALTAVVGLLTHCTIEIHGAEPDNQPPGGALPLAAPTATSTANSMIDEGGPVAPARAEPSRADRP